MTFLIVIKKTYINDRISSKDGNEIAISIF